jgi:hypothetical protein
MNDNFDYSQSAEFYPGRRNPSRAEIKRYMRFASAAEAIQFAIEEMPREMLAAAILEVSDERYEGQSIFDLYKAGAYPLTRAE